MYILLDSQIVVYSNYFPQELKLPYPDLIIILYLPDFHFSVHVCTLNISIQLKFLPDFKLKKY